MGYSYNVSMLLMEFMQTEDPDEIAELYTNTMNDNPKLMEDVFVFADKYKINLGISKDVLNIRKIALRSNHRM